ncbi:MAG: hypothetical protein INQ03_22665 [Candidatus Heimdallarchaeota archaeon]|nr:hypothetical protein [Candidatus Heimdallarchaeota archaeon]
MKISTLIVIISLLVSGIVLTSHTDSIIPPQKSIIMDIDGIKVHYDSLHPSIHIADQDPNIRISLSSIVTQISMELDDLGLDADVPIPLIIEDQVNATYEDYYSPDSGFIISYINIINCENIFFDNVTLVDHRNSYALHVTTSTNITINDFNILGGSHTADYTAVLIEDCTYLTIQYSTIQKIYAPTGYTSTAVDIRNSDDVSILFSVLDNDLATLQSNSTYNGFKFTNTDNIYIDNTNIIDVQAPVINAYQFSQIENLTISNSYTYHLHATTGQIHAYQLDQVTNATLFKFNFNYLYSLATTFDFADEHAIYGAIITNSHNISLSESAISYVDSEANAYIMGISTSTNLTLTAVSFTSIEVKYLRGISVDSVENISLNDISITSVISTQFTGLKIDNALGSIDLEDIVIDGIQTSSLTTAIAVSNSNDIEISSTEVKNIIAQSSSFPTYGILINNVDGIYITTTIVNSVTTIHDLYAYFFIDSTEINMIENQGTTLVSDQQSVVGMYFENSQTIIVENNTLTSFSTNYHSILDSVDIIDAYGLYLISSTAIEVTTNTISSISNWIYLDNDVSDITLTNNIIDSVTSTLVSLTRPDDINYDISTNFTPITWTGITNPANSTKAYTFFVNNQFYSTGNWTSGESISFILENVTLGEYIVKIVLTEISGFNTTDIVIINVIETTIPKIISSPKDLTKAKDVEKEISWIAIDINCLDYSIYRNTTEIQSGIWVNNTAVVLDITDFTLGMWNVTIVFRDTVNNMAVHNTWIKVVNPVELSFSEEPEDMTIIKGVGNYLNFTVDSVNGGNFTLSVDGQPHLVSTWEPDDRVSIDLDFLEIGEYTLDVVVVDEFLQSITFEISVIVLNPPETATDDGFDWDAIADVFEEPVIAENLPYFIGIVTIFAGLGIWQRKRLKKVSTAVAKKTVKRNPKGKKATGKTSTTQKTTKKK